MIDIGRFTWSPPSAIEKDEVPNPIAVALVEAMYGSVSDKSFGLVVGLGGFKRNARDFAFEKRNLTLIDGDEWFPLSHAVVAYDHARHAPLGDVITLDFINAALEPGARAGIELSLETAKELHAALERAITAAEFEEAEVRGKGAPPQIVRAA